MQTAKGPNLEAAGLLVIREHVLRRPKYTLPVRFTLRDVYGMYPRPQRDSAARNCRRCPCETQRTSPHSLGCRQSQNKSQEDIMTLDCGALSRSGWSLRFYTAGGCFRGCALRPALRNICHAKAHISESIT